MSTSVSLAGNLASDPYFTKAKGKARARVNLTLAVNTGRDDNERTDFYRVTAFGQLAEHIRESLSKGDRAVVTGYLNTYVEEFERDDEEINVTMVSVTATDAGPSLLFGTTEFEKMEKSSKKPKEEDEDENTKKGKKSKKDKGSSKSKKGKSKSKNDEGEDDEDDDF